MRAARLNPQRAAAGQPAGAIDLAAATQTAANQRADPSALRAARRHLEDREQLLFTSRSVSVGAMATTLAHEINQPIGTVTNVLRGVLAWLDQRERSADAADADAAPIQTQAQAMAELRQGVRLALDQALFAARIVGRIREFTQSRQPARDPVDMHALLRASVGLLDWEIGRADVAVSLDLAPIEPGPVVLGDAVMLQQVLVNLLRNALDALGEVDARPRRIVLATRLNQSVPARPQIEIEVRDNGCGLSADDEGRLFVPFHSTKPTGMGVGLNICRNFVEMHQGRLWFSRASASEPGCSFHLGLPLVVAKAGGETG
jgi:two-component system, LuxR family, sensor kinase FixL